MRDLYDLEGDGTEYFDDDEYEMDENETDPTDLADDLDEILSAAGAAGVSADTMGKLRDAARALRTEVNRLSDVDGPDLTPAANKIARRVHGVDITTLMQRDYAAGEAVYMLAEEKRRARHAPERRR